MTIRSLVALSLLAPSAALATSQFGEPQFKLTGFYAEIDAGAFSGLQGSKGISNAEPYVGFALGYDITNEISLFGSVSHGSSASNCYATVVGSGSNSVCKESATSTAKPVADNFSMMLFEGGFAYTLDIATRVGLAFRVLGGGVILSPVPKPGLAAFGGTFGGGLGVEYATRFDGMTIGADLLGRFVVPANIPAVTYSARFKYVF